MTVADLDEPRVHAWKIDSAQYQRQEQRRGRRYAYETLDPTATALVVVDMVPLFVSENPYCRGIIPNINRIAGSVRETGGHVAWVLPYFRRTQRSIEFFGDEASAVFEAGNGSGPLQERIAPSLDWKSLDLFTTKTSAGAFFPGHCDLHEMLTERGVDTVIIAGTVTNVCCESTARDASTMGYRVVVVGDGTATVSDEMHNASLTTIYRSFGDVRSTDGVLGLLGGQ